MRIIIAPDSFKECAGAPQVAEAIAAGLRRVWPTAELIRIPLADGGEGTVDVLLAVLGGRKIQVTVEDPLGRPVAASYGLPGDGRTAVIEMAAASGLHLTSPGGRDPRRTSTHGTGELIRDALARGARRILVGLGGSATNDGGAGMAQALGFSLLDGQGRELAPGGGALSTLARIDARGRHPALADCEILGACDVESPLCGPRGASRVFGPQKGADAAMIEDLDRALRHFGEVIDRQLGLDVLELEGGGAAGGLGAGLAAFAGGRLRPGFELIAELCALAERFAGADLVITGEGRLDAQTASGKTPVGVARIAKQLGIPVVALAGTLGEGYQAVYEQGIDAVFSICPGPLALGEAMERVEELLERTAENVARLWAAADPVSGMKTGKEGSF